MKRTASNNGSNPLAWIKGKDYGDAEKPRSLQDMIEGDVLPDQTLLDATSR